MRGQEESKNKIQFSEFYFCGFFQHEVEPFGGRVKIKYDVC